jgi:hypothetical protein
MGATNSRSLCGAKAKRSNSVSAPDSSSYYEDITYSTVATEIEHTCEYSDGVLLPDGRVVLVPSNAMTIGCFNPATNAYSVVVDTSRYAHVAHTGVYIGRIYSGGVLLRDGRVVFVPHNSIVVGIFDPTTNTYNTIPGAPGGAAYSDGVLLRDGRVLFVPYCATTIGIFDPVTNAYSTVPGVQVHGTSGAYKSGVLLNDGRVVFVPWNAMKAGIFNPATNEYREVAQRSPTGFMHYSAEYANGVLLPDGRVLFVPRDTWNIGIFDPVTNRYGVIQGTPGKYLMFSGGVLLPDGRVVFVPCVRTEIGLFYPTARKLVAIEGEGAPGRAAYQGGVLLHDGRVMLIPWNTTSIGILTLSDKKAQARARVRAEAIKQELVAAAWHPKRMTEWCLDTDERRELAEMCG